VLNSLATFQPRWMRDLKRFLPLKSQFVLSGNLRDLQLSPTDNGLVAEPLVPDLVLGCSNTDVPT
jgi:hypothetical protein